MEECVFCAIANDRAPARKIYENKTVLAFLDTNPIRSGHILLITKEHFPYVFALSDGLFIDLFSKAKELSRHLEKALGVDRIGILVSGIAVPHAHIHLVPVYEKKDLDPCLARSASEEELTSMQARILKAMA